MSQGRHRGADETMAGQRTRLLVTRDPDTAETWAEALDDAGVDALIEISDAQDVQPGSSPLVGVLGAHPLDFVHVLTVRPADRERALAALVDAGWDGREGLTTRAAPNVRGMLTAAAFTIAGIAAFLVLRAVTA
ncbi:MAG: hypothetical protein WD800_01230 [Dehalococcoidia bacterium]